MAIRAALIVASTLFATACAPLPGEVVGTFQVTMTLAENSCGPTAVNLLDGKRYAVELRKDGKEAFWRIPGQTPLSGKYEEPNFTFEYSAVVAQDSNDAGTGGCRLVQTELLKGTITVAGADASLPADAGTEDAGEDAGVEVTADEEATGTRELIAEHTMTISAQSGSDCAHALSPQGAFAKLPCTLRYELKGSPRKPL